MNGRGSSYWSALAAGLLIAAGAGTAALGQQPVEAVAPAVPVAPATAPAEAKPPPRRWPREVVILQGAADAAEFWKKLDAPDWIITRPGPTRIGEAPRAEAAVGVPVANIDAVHVAGTVEGDTARIVLDLHGEVFADGPTWVPLRLDVPVVPSAREGDRELELRKGEGGLWEARLEGAREHGIRIEAVAPVRVGSQRRTLELAVPEASATSFDLMLPRRAFDVDLGTGEAAPKPEPVEGKGLRVAAHVRPRSRLVVSWSEQDAAGPRAAPLLSAQVEMAVDVDAEGVSVRSSWAVSCSRGVARSLQIRLGDDEKVAGVRLNDQFQASGIERSEGANLLTIPLSEPLRAGESRRLALETRRPTSGAGSLNFSGYPLVDAGEQSGFLGVTQGPNLFLSVEKSQGLRRIDPRDLPTALKTRLGTTIAMQFSEQPFALTLEVEPAPPLFRVDASARLSVEPDGVRNETTLDVERVRGSLYEIEVAVPPGLKVTSIGPAELVEAAVAPPSGEGEAGSRSLRIRLTALARDRSQFRLALVGREEAVEPGDVRLGLFAPQGAVATTTTMAVSAGAGVALESLDVAMVKEPTADPAGAKPEPGVAPALRLRTSRNPTELALRLERRAMEIRRETSLAARISRRSVEVRQETKVRVRHGAPTTLIVLTPAGVAPGWEVSDGQSPLRKEELDEPSSDARRVRLTFDRPVADASLTFHFRLPLDRPLTPEGPTPVRIPWIAIEPGTPGPCSISVSTDADVAAAVDDPTWTVVEPAGDSREGAAYRLERDDAADALAASARLVEPVAMPAVVASRAFVRSSLDADGGLRVRAWYALESHPRSLSVSLPPGASWLRARVDGQAVERIDATGEGGGDRINLPAESAERPVLLDLEYRAPAASARRPWSAPTLLGGAEVLQTYWLAQVPWTLVSPMPPRGWIDEGRWAWDGFAASRRPAASASRLAAWAAGPALAAALDDAPEGDDAARGLLFSRPGAPAPMDPVLVSRAGAVLAFSGLGLLTALTLTFWPAWAPWVAAAAAVAGLPAAMFLPAAAWAFAMQAAVFGAGLGLAIFLLHRRATRESASSLHPRGPGGSSLVVTGSSHRSASEVGSDDSTAIRVRTSSTMDYLAAPPPPGPDPDASLASRRTRGLPLE